MAMMKTMRMKRRRGSEGGGGQRTEDSGTVGRWGGISVLRWILGAGGNGEGDEGEF